MHTATLLKTVRQGERGAKDKNKMCKSPISSLLRHLEMQTEDEKMKFLYAPEISRIFVRYKELLRRCAELSELLNLAFDVWLLAGGNMGNS